MKRCELGVSLKPAKACSRIQLSDLNSVGSKKTLIGSHGVGMPSSDFLQTLRATYLRKSKAPTSPSLSLHFVLDPHPRASSTADPIVDEPKNEQGSNNTRSGAILRCSSTTSPAG